MSKYYIRDCNFSSKKNNSFLWNSFRFADYVNFNIPVHTGLEIFLHQNYSAMYVTPITVLQKHMWGCGFQAALTAHVLKAEQ